MKNMKYQEQKQSPEYLFGKQILGKGSYGKVIKGKQKNSDKKVALKLLYKQSQNSIYAKQAAKNEVRALKLLKNKVNIVKFYNEFESNGFQVLALQLCEKGDLRQLIKNHLIPKEKLKVLMKQILKGYMQIYKTGLIHRDFKLSNILLTKEDQVKICDFGFSIMNEQVVSERKLQLGSYFHMSPEILANNMYTSKGDVWALGLVYFQMLTGKLAWVEEDTISLFHKIKNFPIQKFFTNQMSESDKKFLSRTLCFNPNQRAEPEELIELLENIQDRKKREDDEDNQNTNQSDLTCSQLTNISDSSFLEKILDLAKFQNYLAIVICKIMKKSTKFSQLINSIPIISLLQKQSFEKLEYLNQNTMDKFKDSKQHIQFLRKVHQAKMRNYQIQQGKIQYESNSELPVNSILRWLNSHITAQSNYLLFVLYDYLITYRCMWDMLHPNNNIQHVQYIRVLEKSGFDIHSVLKSFKKQIEHSHKKIQYNFLEILEKRLRSLAILPKLGRKYTL